MSFPGPTLGAMPGRSKTGIRELVKLEMGQTGRKLANNCNLQNCGPLLVPVA